jgi:hypothetical protein
LLASGIAPGSAELNSSLHTGSPHACALAEAANAEQTSAAALASHPVFAIAFI